MSQIKNIIIMTLFNISISCYANSSSDVIHVHSDSAIYNYKTGINVFEGAVSVDQGDTHITADKLITKNNTRNEIQEATAYGIKERAHYWTLQKKNQPYLHAYANLIKFYPATSNIRLEENALVTQGENSFRGALILYNNAAQTISVPPTKNGKAYVVYHPEAKV